VVNGLGHWWGYRNYESADTSTNLTPWGVWIGGEELHNNHHAFPSSARFAMRRWEFDIGWGAIRVLQALRLAKVLRVAPAMDVRPNIAVPDAETLKALLSHRFQAMTDYQRNVFMPALREEARHAGAKLRRLLPRRLRRGRTAARSSANGSPSARASAPWWNIARAWQRCWKHAAMMPPSACVNCRPGAGRPRKAALPRCRPMPRD